MKGKLIIMLICFIPIACFKSNNNKLIEKKKEIVEGVYLNVFIKDTIEMKEEFGKIKFFRKQDDTIKIMDKDDRRIFIALGIKGNKGNKGNREAVKEGDKFNSSVTFKPINVNDTIVRSFSIHPSFKGDALIVGFLTDTYFLHSYAKDLLVRMITLDVFFKKEIYIK